MVQRAYISHGASLCPNQTPNMPRLTTYPPFPEDIPTAPLQGVDYQVLKARDQGEIGKLWKAATELGFW